MESKLAMYQLAAVQPIPTITAGIQPPANPITGVRPPITTTVNNPVTSVGGGKQNWFKRNNINFNTVAGGLESLLNLAGGTANIINAFKSGQQIDLNGHAASEQERQMLYQMAMAKQQGGSNEAMMQMFMQNQQMMMQMFANAGMRGGDDYNNNSNNIDRGGGGSKMPLYIGLGVGGLLLVGVIVAVAMKK